MSSRPAAPFIPDKLLMSVAGSRGSPGQEGQLTGLGDEQLRTLARNSIESTLLAADEKAALLAGIDAHPPSL